MKLTYHMRQFLGSSHEAYLFDTIREFMKRWPEYSPEQVGKLLAQWVEETL